MNLSVSLDLSSWKSLIRQIRDNCTTEVLLKDAGKILNEGIADQFFDQGDPAWVPLSARRIKDRRAGSDPPILMDTGSLFFSWTEPGGEHVELIDTDSITVGTNLFYAGTMQDGGHVMGHEIPARPVSLGEEAIEKIADSVAVNLLGV